MKQKKEERTPILYKKYKKEQEEKPAYYPMVKPKTSFIRKTGDLLALLILFGLICLAGVGTAALISPVMRDILIESLYR